MLQQSLLVSISLYHCYPCPSFVSCCSKLSSIDQLLDSLVLASHYSFTVLYSVPREIDHFGYVFSLIHLTFSLTSIMDCGGMETSRNCIEGRGHHCWLPPRESQSSL